VILCPPPLSALALKIGVSLLTRKHKTQINRINEIIKNEKERSTWHGIESTS